MGDLNPNGPCQVACSGDGGITVEGDTTNFNSTNVNISGDTLISGGLTVNKHATFNSGVTVNSGDLTINSGNLNMSGDLNLTGNAYISGQLWILGPNGPCQVACSGDGGITVEGDTTNFNSTNVNISGDTLISGGLTVNKHATFNSGVSISGDLNVAGSLSVSGCIKSYQCVTDSSAASYTLSASDFGKIVHYNPASDAAFNLPTTASVPTIANGWQATVMNLSSNNITLTPLGGLTLKSDGTIITGQYQAATVYYQGGDWYAAGALSS